MTKNAIIWSLWKTYIVSNRCDFGDIASILFIQFLKNILSYKSFLKSFYMYSFSLMRKCAYNYESYTNAASKNIRNAYKIILYKTLHSVQNNYLKKINYANMDLLCDYLTTNSDKHKRLVNPLCQSLRITYRIWQHQHDTTRWCKLSNFHHITKASSQF